MEKYKTTGNFVLKSILGSYVLIPVGEQVFINNVLVDVNETGAFMFGQLENGVTLEQLSALVLEEYDADSEVVKADVKRFSEKMLKLGAVKVERE